MTTNEQQSPLVSRAEVKGVKEADKNTQEARREQLLGVIGMEATAASKRAQALGLTPPEIKSSGDKVMAGLGNILRFEQPKKGDKGFKGPDLHQTNAQGQKIYDVIHMVDGHYYPLPPVTDISNLPADTFALTSLVGREGDIYAFRIKGAGGEKAISLRRADVIEISLVTQRDLLSDATSKGSNDEETAPPFPPESVFASEQGKVLLGEISANITTSNDMATFDIGKSNNTTATLTDRMRELQKHFPIVHDIEPMSLIEARAAQEKAKLNLDSHTPDVNKLQGSLTEALKKAETARTNLKPNDEATQKSLADAEAVLKEAQSKMTAYQALVDAKNTADANVTNLETKYADLMNDPPTSEALNGYFHEHLKTDLPAHLSLLEAERQKLITLLEREKASPVSRPQEVDRLTNEVAHVDKLVAKLHSIQKDPNISNGFFVSLQRGEQAPEVVSAMKEAFSTGKISEALSESLADKLISDILPKDVTPEQKKEMSKAMSILLKTGGILLVGIICMLVDAGTEGKSNFATVIASLMNSGRFGDLSYNDQQALNKLKEAKSIGKSIKFDPEGKAQIVN